MATYPVKYINNTMRGAPVIHGTNPGALISALDALLITGWGQVTALSVTVASGIATATLQAGDTFEKGAVVLVAGATPAALNGEARVLSASNTSITWATTAADGPATGTVTVRYASVGWEKLYPSINKAVYRSQDPLCPRHYLYVDDTNGLYARVRGFESMSDISTGIGPFPTDALLSGGGYWHKSTTANNTPITYALAADSQAFLVGLTAGVATSSINTALVVRGFGFPVVLNPAGDAYATFLSCDGSSNSLINSGGLSGATADSAASGMTICPRGWQGLGTAVLQRPLPSSGLSNSLSGGCDWFGAAPSAIDGQVKTSPMLLKDQVSNAPPRSIVPGVHYIPQTGAPALFAHMSQHDGAGPLAGRKLLAVHVGTSLGSTSGVALIDLVGPWR